MHTFFFRLTSTTVCVLFSPFRFYIFLSILLFPALFLLVITVVLFEILIFSCNFCSHWNEWQTSHKTFKLAWFWSLTISTYFHLQPSFQLSNVLHSNSALYVGFVWVDIIAIDWLQECAHSKLWICSSCPNKLLLLAQFSLSPHKLYCTWKHMYFCWLSDIVIIVSRHCHYCESYCFFSQFALKGKFKSSYHLTCAMKRYEPRAS